MKVETLLQLLNTEPQNVTFEQVIETIDQNYNYKPARFLNGIGNDTVVNEAGSNEGSCKIFAFALLHDLGEAQTLACFGKYYRQDVLLNLKGTDHANIRTFMRYGWDGIEFEKMPLKDK